MRGRKIGCPPLIIRSCDQPPPLILHVTHPFPCSSLSFTPLTWHQHRAHHGSGAPPQPTYGDWIASSLLPNPRSGDKAPSAWSDASSPSHAGPTPAAVHLSDQHPVDSWLLPLPTARIWWRSTRIGTSSPAPRASQRWCSPKWSLHTLPALVLPDEGAPCAASSGASRRGRYAQC
jgi:hypothetical protein